MCVARVCVCVVRVVGVLECVCEGIFGEKNGQKEGESERESW